MNNIDKADDFTRAALAVIDNFGSVSAAHNALIKDIKKRQAKAREERADTLAKIKARKQRTHELIVCGAVVEKILGTRDPEKVKSLLLRAGFVKRE